MSASETDLGAISFRCEIGDCLAAPEFYSLLCTSASVATNSCKGGDGLLHLRHLKIGKHAAVHQVLEHVQWLDLLSCEATSASIHAVRDGLAGSTNLDALRVTLQFPQSVPDDLLSDIPTKSLRILEIRCCYSDSIYSLAELLQDPQALPALEGLGLRGSPKGELARAKGLGNRPRVSVRWSQSSLDSSEAPWLLLVASFATRPEMKDLWLEKLDSFPDKEFLFASLGRHQWRTLCITSCSFGHGSAIALVTAAGNASSLRSSQLDLTIIPAVLSTGDFERSRELGHSVTCFLHVCKLVRLDLSWCWLRDPGAAQISEALLHLTGASSLRALILAYNKIGDEGALAFVTCSSSKEYLHKLRLLDLSSNEFGPESIEALQCAWSGILKCDSK